MAYWTRVIKCNARHAQAGMFNLKDTADGMCIFSLLFSVAQPAAASAGEQQVALELAI